MLMKILGEMQHFNKHDSCYRDILSTISGGRLGKVVNIILEKK